nr:endonuclease [uncultured bacterium]
MGGGRLHLNVHIDLTDLEHRARSAMLDFGGRLSPEALRMLACDAAVVPIVMNGAGQPLDVGRATRTIPDGLRRAVTARDRGCAHPGCDRPPSWAEIHHILEWEDGGPTRLDNPVMLCRVHHRLMHYSGWNVRIRDGLPEFIPPRWIDPDQVPRRNPHHELVQARAG